MGWDEDEIPKREELEKLGLGARARRQLDQNQARSRFTAIFSTIILNTI